MELYDWVQYGEAPPTAVLMLAALLARRGRRDVALRVLDARGGEEHDADLMSLRRWLRVTQRGDEDARSRDLRPAQEVPDDPDTAQVSALAMQLVGQPHLITTIVKACGLEPNARTISLLRDALWRAADRLPAPLQQLRACQGLAELALLVSDHGDARRWAHRGLEIDPYSAPLALLLAQLPDEPEIAPSAVTSLRLASQAHPTYPDVRAALIRKEFAQGQAQVARGRLDAWLRQEPHNALAHELERERAA